MRLLFLLGTFPALLTALGSTNLSQAARPLASRGSQVFPQHLRSIDDPDLPPFRYKDLAESVVQIRVKDSNGYEFIGTGFFVVDDQHILTLYHLINGSVSIAIDGTRGAQFTANQVKINRATDLALLRISEHSSRYPLHYSSLAGVKSESNCWLVKGPSQSGQPEVSKGLVLGTRTIDGQTILEHTAKTTRQDLGAPILGADRKVLAIARMPFPDQELKSVGATVMGIGFLSKPIPWKEFVGGSRPDPQRTLVDNRGPRVQLAQDFAQWLNQLRSARLRWKITSIRTESANPPTIQPRLDECYHGVTEALKTKLEDLKGSVNRVEGVSMSEFDQRVAALTGASREFWEDQAAFFESLQQADLSKASNAAKASSEAEGKLDSALDAVTRFLEPQKWYTWNSIAFEFNPAIWASMFTASSIDAIPDPDHPEKAAVATTEPGSDFQPGDVLVGVAIDAKQPFVEVRTWRDVVAFLTKRPTGSRPYVRVLRQGAHAMFYARPPSKSEEGT